MRKSPLLIAALVLVLAVLPLLVPAADAGTWTGWITDENCAAKGAKAEHADCARKCHKEGAKLVFYNSGDEKIYKLDNQELAAQHIGHEVKIEGEATGDSIKVTSIGAAAM